jgi:nucleoside-diphosphate-sugar epimerase
MDFHPPMAGPVGYNGYPTRAQTTRFSNFDDDRPTMAWHFQPANFARQVCADRIHKMTSIAVTGASGFVGQAVLRQLRGLEGVQIRAGSRSGADVAGQPRTRMDVLDQTALRAAFEGVDAVVHCAVGDRATTVEGTRLVLQAAAEAGARRVVHFSSIAVYGTATGVIEEQRPLLAVGPGPGHYATWKVEAEQAALAARIEVVRLRPSIIYGAGSTLFVGNVARRIATGSWGTFGAEGEGTCNLVHVDDVARAALLALTAPRAAGEAFNIDGGQAMTWNAWFESIAKAMGAQSLPSRPAGTLRRRSRLALPAKAAVKLLPPLRPLLAGRLLAAPAGAEVDLFGLKASYPAGKARSILGFTPQVTLEHGLAESAAWLRTEGLAR